MTTLLVSKVLNPVCNPPSRCFLLLVVRVNLELHLVGGVELRAARVLLALDLVLGVTDGVRTVFDVGGSVEGCLRQLEVDRLSVIRPRTNLYFAGGALVIV